MKKIVRKSLPEADLVDVKKNVDMVTDHVNLLSVKPGNAQIANELDSSIQALKLNLSALLASNAAEDEVNREALTEVIDILTMEDHLLHAPEKDPATTKRKLKTISGITGILSGK